MPVTEVIKGTCETKINDVVKSLSVKVHTFLPSDRTIITVVGRDNEHWTDPDIQFCTCKDYYFKALSSDNVCYHVKAVNIAIQEKRFEKIEFNDSEYNGFVNALMLDNTVKLLSGC